MSDKYFPIRTETACQLKWTWSTVRLREGNTSSCHRVEPDPINSESFDEFHNTPKKIQDRLLMLDGKWPQGGCEYCQKIENVGGVSDRQNHLKIPNLVPPELDSNPLAVNVSPRILEIYFNNTCNLACVYCWDGFSSKIEQENRKFGRFDQQGVVIENKSHATNQSDLTQVFWDWMKKNCQTLERLHILGGEPFYQADFYRCFDFFESNPCPKLELNVVSNLIVDSDKFQLVINKLKSLIARRRIKRFDLTASVDSFGASQNYVRHGFNEAVWKKNFEFAASCRWITLQINQTLTGLILKEVPDLLRYVNALRANRTINHYFSLPVFTHNFLHPEVFGPGYFDKTFEEILELMPAGNQRDYMNGIKMQLAVAVKNADALTRLRVFLEEIDRRRNTNWQQAFPWLEKEVNNVV